MTKKAAENLKSGDGFYFKNSTFDLIAKKHGVREGKPLKFLCYVMADAKPGEEPKRTYGNSGMPVILAITPKRKKELFSTDWLTIA